MLMPIDVNSHAWAASDCELAQLCAAIPPGAPLALDCEFIRRITFHPIPALLQLGWRGANGELEFALLDPLSIDDWKPLKASFERADAVVMHAAGEDVQVLRRLGIHNFPLFDTQLAAALVLGEDGLGYSALVECELAQQVPQASSVQRSNWLARPLSRMQLEYALLDVAWLPDLHSRLSAQLETLGRSDWHRQECAALFQQSEFRPREEAWWSVRGADRVRQPVQRARLKALAAWRESRAMSLDRPRGMLLADDAMLVLCKDPAGLTPTLRRSRFGREIAADELESLRRQLLEADAADAPPLKQLTQGQTAELKRLRTLVAEQAQALRLPSRLLANKRKLGDWVAGAKVDFGGWQTPLMEEVLSRHARKEQERRAGQTHAVCNQSMD